MFSQTIFFIDELWTSDPEMDTAKRFSKDNLLCYTVHQAFRDIVHASTSLTS